jgi:hypothetical protein
MGAGEEAEACLLGASRNETVVNDPVSPSWPGIPAKKCNAVIRCDGLVRIEFGEKFLNDRPALSVIGDL